MIQGYGDGTNKEISRPKRMYEEEEEEEEDGPPAVLTGPLRLPTFIRAHQPPKRSRKTLHGQFMVAASSIRTPTLNPFSSLSAKIAVDKECAARASHKATAKAPITFATKALGPPRSAALSNRPLPSNKKAHEYMNKCIRGEFDFLPRAHRPSIVYGGKTLGFRVISPNAPPNLGTIVTAIDLGLVTTKDMPVTVTRNSHPMQQSSHLPSHIDRYLLKVEKSPHILEKSSNISAMSVKPRNVTSVHSYSLTSASSMHPSCIIAGLDNKSTRFSVPPSGIPSAFSNPNSKANKRQSSVLLSEIPLEQRLRDVRHLMIVCNRILYGTVKSNMLLIGSVVSSYIPSDSLRPRPKKIRIDSQPPKGGLHGRSALSYCLKKKIKLLKTKYYVDLILAYFLQNGGHFTDFTTWRGKNLPREIIEYIKCNLLPGKTDEELRFAFEVVSVGPSIFGPAMLNVSPPSSVTESNVSSDNSSGKLVSSHSAFKKSSVYVTPSPSNPKASMRLTAPPKASVRLISSSSSKASIRLALSASNMSSIRSMPPSSSSMSSIRSMPPSLSNMSSIRSSSQSPIVEPRRKSSISQMKQSVLTTKALSRHNSLSAVYDSSIGSQQQIVERAKQEASVMQKIGDLRKEGLWSLKRLPKVQESARSKAHWDYLLEEMAWLSADFAQERKWKKAAAKKCARMIIKHFQEKEMKAEKAEKEQLIRLKKLAAAVSKEIKVFWTNIEKLVEYKQQTWIDARKKKVLDSHLNFIVDQTEKYSSWLTEGLNRSLVESAETSRVSSPAAVSKRAMEINAVPDDDYLPSMSESDNEDTIAKEEEDMDCDVKNEIELLKKESELPIEDIIQQLPKEFLEKPAACGPNDENEMGCKPNLADSQPSTLISKKEETTDDEFTLATSESDDEETIVEEEKEKNVDYALELNDLKNESELPIEKLLEKYEALYASDYETSMSELEETCSEDTASLKDLSLIDSNTEEEKQTSVLALNSTNPSQEITDIAATAESFQPKGNTLSTTQVCTKVPFLLKHQLREYQHIGLDWLNAMYEKKLNGILADEMGLGKTIQTISLLAHLACEKGVWGPHLIVVPTSVMLNWEMEFKKWCPAFKILTYYGTPKERKQKRMGWTKQNAFHVCITSYKLVVQDHYCFRRKRWIYLILDEAQHIKNFKSQRWQMLLNFQSTHRLLLTGTPLQNNLMELWSLMHFLMPNVFQSHRDFREWFVNPVTGMIEGNHEYNESLIKRLHKVLRPFLLRRLKCEVEKQLPKKYEHIVMCRLSKRQRYLYDDFMSQTKTKETLATGNFLSVINILMQLRKVCNHPNMFEPRPILSPFMMKGLTYSTSSVVSGVLDYDPIQHICLWALNLRLADIEMCVSAFAAHRIKKFQTPPWIIEMTDCLPEIEPPPPCGKIKLTITSTRTHPNHHNSSQPRATVLPQARVNSIPNRAVAPFNTSVTNSQHYMVSGQHHSVNPSRPIMNCVTPSGSSQVSAHSEYTLQLLQQSSGGVPVSPLASVGSQMVASAPFAVQMPSGNRMPLGIGRLVQTSSGQQFLLTPSVSTVATDSITSSVSSTMSFSPLNSSATSSSIISGANPSNIATATVLPQVQKVPSSVIPPIIGSFNRAPSMNSINSGITSHINYNKPIGRVAPLNIHPPLSSVGNSQNSSSFRSTAVHPVRPQPRAKVEVPTTINIKEKNNNEFYIERVALHQTESRLKKLQSLGKANILRCAACPMYGADLMEAVSFCKIPCRSRKDIFKFSCGYVNCLNAPSMEQRPSEYLHYTLHLCNMINTPRKCIDSLAAIIKRFAFVIPSVTAPPIELHVSHPQPSKLNAMKRNIEELNCKVTPSCALLHPIISNTATYFPEPRLIEYDCGKLQRLAHLLWELKSGSHRALIFTQMTRMLDILEQFLSYHGHTYLRLDGSTKIEMRQALMEQFNADRKIFCFILSTRSGGIGVNLTGADTVIFYDSDWNPTMDAQAQDRCHRIGQTRDVHIYRLISEKTIEENILKKANQKRLLGDLAIDGGNFTTAFFKKNTLNELFGFDETHADSKMPVSNSVRDTSDNSSELLKNYSEIQLEQALGMAEEELDLKAAAIARDEAAAEFAEFDESIPFDNDSRDVEEKSPAEEELDRLMEQLTPVEKYAMRFFESLQEPISLEHLKQAEEEIEAQKREWELGRLKALKEEEERQFQKRLLNTDDPLLSYGRETVTNQVFITISGQEEMPVWSPPTPPIDDDMYFDLNVCFSYSQITMAESILPPVFTKKENKRLKIETMLPGTSVIAVTRKQKVRKDDITIPRSLFDRPTAAILKMRREAKLQKVKGFMSSANFAKTIPAYASLKSTSVIVGKPPSHDSPQDHQEWLVYEDWAILQIIQNYQGLPLALTIVQPAHVPNWDMCGDAVNSLKSRLYRSPKQCKNRYESVIVPREEGKILYDANPKKPKKTKGIYKTKNNRPMRTSQLFVQDNNNSFTSLTHVRYSVIENIGKAKDRSARRWFAHAAKNQRLPPILAETGVNYEQPLYPSQIALNRAERIAREKKNQTALAAQVVEQQLVAQRQGQQTANIASANLMQHQTQAVIASLSHPHQIQNATIAALASSNLRATQRTTVTAVGTTTTMTVHEMVAAVGQVRALTTCAGSNSPATSTVVSVAGLTAVQLQAASQRLASVLPTATTTGSTLGQLTPTQRNLSQLAQYQTLRQNAILRQQREQTLKHHHLKRFQAAQHGSSHRVTSKVSANSASNNFPVSAAQQRLTQQQQAASIKQGRQMTEVEVAQLVKRQHQLQQQQKQAQLATAQILAQAQQVQQQAQLQQAQQQQASITPPLQTSVATLVKTVSAPSIGGAQSVTIPVTAAGVNINVSLPQGKPVNTQAKASTTITNQQLRQLQLQQQLILQARKGPKVTNLSQLTKVQGKGANLTTSALTNQLNTVQIIQQSGPGVGSQQTKSLQTTMTMQQIQQAMKQVMPQTIPLVSTTQGNGSGNAVNITQSQILSHTLLPTSPSTIKSGVTMPLTHSSNAAVASTTSLQTLITSSSPTARIMPVTQSTSGTTTSIPSPVIKQTIQVVSATPNLAASLQSQATVRGEPSIVSSIKPQMTTLPSATLTTSSMLKSGSAVVVGQQQTATILQQVAAPSSSGLTPQQAVTLAVRAAASQAQGQVQIQVQQSSHSSLIAQQSSQSRLSQISPGQAGINIQQNMPTVQTSTQQTSVLTNNITGIASDSLVHSPTHVVMQNAAVSNSQTNISVPAAMSPTSATAQVVQAAIQAARQQQAAQQQQVAQQQQQPLQQPKPSYTMRLRNPK